MRGYLYKCFTKLNPSQYFIEYWKDFKELRSSVYRQIVILELLILGLLGTTKCEDKMNNKFRKSRSVSDAESNSEHMSGLPGVLGTDMMISKIKQVLQALSLLYGTMLVTIGLAGNKQKIARIMAVVIVCIMLLAPVVTAATKGDTKPIEDKFKNAVDYFVPLIIIFFIGAYIFMMWDTLWTALNSRNMEVIKKEGGTLTFIIIIAIIVIMLRWEIVDYLLGLTEAI